MSARAKGAAEELLGAGLPNSAEEELRREINGLKLQLEEYASVNASLEERLEKCENENKRLRLENEFLCAQLTSPDNHHTAAVLSLTNESEKQEAVVALAADEAYKEYGGNLLAVGEKEEKMRTSMRTWKLDTETVNRLLAALEDAPLHMSYCDSELRYVWFNHTLKGLTHQEIVGKRDEEIFGGESEGVRQLVMLKCKAMHTGLTQVGQVTLDWPENGRVTWMVTCRPHLSVDGLHVAGLSTASIDITEQVEIKKCLTKLRAEMTARQATEDELRKAVQVTEHAEDAIQAKNVFLAIMSHEIRTPLNGLLGLAEALESLELSAEQQELVSAILSSGVIVADILSDILDLASMEFAGLELEERPFDLSEIVQDIMKMAVAATRGKDLVVKSEVLNELPSRVIGDAVRIRQIIKYLVLNAIKFTERGSVWIRTKVHHSSSQLIQSSPCLEQAHVAVPSASNTLYQQCDNRSQATLYCEVVDTGVGIPEEAFATLFDKFKQVSEGPTRSFGGTGLGLALCKRLVEFMGGQLHVRSEVGKGSTFAFTVICKIVCEEGFEQGGVHCERGHSEAAETSHRGGSKAEDSNAMGVSGPRILLAEDNQVNVMVAISMLKRLGFTAKVVANGVEALEAIRKDKYDLVLLDICMPLMDGLQVAHAIRCFEQTGEWPTDLTSATINPEHQSSRSSGTSGTQQRLPIVAVTANALRSDVDKYLAHGMDAFIAKPVVFQKLQEILQRYLPLRHPPRAC